LYSPKTFQVNDPATLNAFIRKHSFATIVTHANEVLQATHMPVLLEADRGPHGTLVSHMARANSQWRDFENGKEVLIIFTGPHAYISPAWYITEPAVPTWNYAAVHVYGIPRIIADHDRFVAMLRKLVEFYEAGREGRWHGDMPLEFRDQMMRGIVGIDFEITRIEGKFKLSQNRPVDAPGVIAALNASEDHQDRETAAMMSMVMPSLSNEASTDP
jgi:transcriptional regulator